MNRCLLNPTSLPMKALHQLHQKPGDGRLLIVVGSRRLFEVDEVRTWIMHRYPDAVRLDGEHREIMIRQRRGSTRVRSVYWPAVPMGAHWSPDVVVVDQTLPFLAISCARAAARSRCVPW